MNDERETADVPASPGDIGSTSEKRKGGKGRGPSTGSRNANRRQARETALQTLYEVDVTDHSAAEVLIRLRAQHALNEEVHQYLSHLVLGVMANRDRIDMYLSAAASAFPIAQLPAVDRNVLRVAIFELLEPGDVPPKAAINEAVDLAKRYGGDNSGRFVNGVLGTIFSRIQTELTGAPPSTP
jgi:N utilization substance protein B